MLPRRTSPGFLGSVLVVRTMLQVFGKVPVIARATATESWVLRRQLGAPALAPVHTWCEGSSPSPSLSCRGSEFRGGASVAQTCWLTQTRVGLVSDSLQGQRQKSRDHCEGISRRCFTP